MFGYEMHTQRAPMVKGAANALYFFFAVLSAELQKLADARVEWILYFDADVVPLHPGSPLDIVLPLLDDVDASETFKDLILILPSPHTSAAPSLSPTWMHISPSTLTLLTAATHSLSTLTPASQDMATTALQTVLGQVEWKGRVAWQSAAWYGTCPASEWDGGAEQTSAMFAQLGEGSAFEREKRARTLLARAEAGRDDGKRVEAMRREASEFWARERQVREMGSGE
ncbi:uncharacterized protein M421DRAFT_9865 [Didymella exigua CBS 183.55]|uniref:Glycosyltransferase family 34 protein n=1 Tax=Didymella exigua CBS 183.55 TaxID=1150837 RepID=A0A6A5R684_9PLEO|nr:uncharacterized protein M421DRAFT_9865 [Didymella exigua CBS 183.55]KAF1923222.1 hypothetical protein M421DRAFT_9865 [Didymella exigua CBS 183.55]